MLNDIIVTVVIPIYNAADSLGRCLACLSEQTHEALEIICVNDGSTDATSEILDTYTSKDNRITVITQSNRGAGAARNAGFEKATGKYVIFLDSDDLFEPDMIRSMVMQLEEYGADAAVCLYDAFDSATFAPVVDCWRPPLEIMDISGAFSPVDKSDRLFQLVQGWPWDKMFRTEFIREHRITYPELPNTQDMVFVFEALVSAEKICFVKKTLVHRSMNRSGSISNSRTQAVSSVGDACVILLERLGSKGVLGLYQNSLYRFYLNLLLWHLRTLNGDAQKTCYSLLRSEWTAALKLDEVPADVYAPQDYREYRRVCRRSYRRYVMSKKIRELFKRILPPPANTFNREMERVLSDIAALKCEFSKSAYGNNTALCCKNSEEIAEIAENTRRLTQLVEQQQKYIDLLMDKIDRLS